MKPTQTPRPRSGASAIEFALTLPVILLIFSAIVEFGWVFFQMSAALGAVRDGVRLGVTYAVEDDPETVAEARARTVLTGYGLDCSDTLSCEVDASIVDDGINYATLTLTISRPYEPMLDLVPSPDTIRAQMTMVLEDQD